MVEDSLRLLVTVENWDIELDATSHQCTFEIRKHHLKQLKQVLRQMYDHPASKFSIKMQRKGL